MLTRLQRLASATNKATVVAGTTAPTLKKSNYSILTRAHLANGVSSQKYSTGKQMRAFSSKNDDPVAPEAALEAEEAIESVEEIASKEAFEVDGQQVSLEEIALGKKLPKSHKSEPRR